MRTVAIVLNLKDDEQSHFFEKHLRETLFPENVVSYANLPNTQILYETSETFRKLLKGVKEAQKLRDDYIQKHN